MNAFDISADEKQISCATLPFPSLSPQLHGFSEVTNTTNSKAMNQMIDNLLSDLELLWRGLEIRNILKTLGAGSICSLKDRGAYVLTNWAKNHSVCRKGRKE